MADSWVGSYSFDIDADPSLMEAWEAQLADRDGSVARIPDRGVDITVYSPGDLPFARAAEQMYDDVRRVVSVDPCAAEVMRESEWARRAEAPSMPELMGATEIADELSVTRQRVHQLRALSIFPAPLVELAGGAVWDAAAVRRFGQQWARKPGRPRAAHG